MKPCTLALLVLLCCAWTATAPHTTAQENGELRVLFVGHDPESPAYVFADKEKARVRALHRERTPAFESLLRYHFKHVRVVYASDYRIEMSDKADVTIFDALPTPIKRTVNKVDPETGERIYRAATYLPASFSRPVLLTASNTPRIGEPNGIKLDWM